MKYLTNAFEALNNTLCPLITDYACVNILHEEGLFKYLLILGVFVGETIGGDLLLDKIVGNKKEVSKTIYDNEQKYME
ncbi:hypothetical protein EXM98_14150 [Clostridium botulinum]|uniref:hypothetical protein n=1 Tax=Clostridium botulinum TaxID=1491 RepID=UPI00111C13AF|nr:hypothetical protein [Clostridium botulinum]MBY6800471.1 hypothetical protein [Clostridium botulinum]MBY6997808.1 hypothetical protein [Clostridium botulinum]MBY7010065.1 hypothetical protein [Clostridium botulinum]MCR1154638.1 hypothetical protein [Clostridium botulinum]MCS6166915.1 hypothetical protein [Clostridium botulinum]